VVQGFRWSAEVVSLPLPRCPYRLKEFAVNWFRCDGFGFNAGELARVCTVDFTLICIGHCVVKTCLQAL
jgi:hypothetical protein